MQTCRAFIRQETPTRSSSAVQPVSQPFYSIFSPPTQSLVRLTYALTDWLNDHLMGIILDWLRTCCHTHPIDDEATWSFVRDIIFTFSWAEKNHRLVDFVRDLSWRRQCVCWMLLLNVPPTKRWCGTFYAPTLCVWLSPDDDCWLIKCPSLSFLVV